MVMRECLGSSIGKNGAKKKHAPCITFVDSDPSKLGWGLIRVVTTWWWHILFVAASKLIYIHVPLHRHNGGRRQIVRDDVPFDRLNICFEGV